MTPLERIFRDPLAQGRDTDTSDPGAVKTIASLLPIVDVLLAKHADRVLEPRIADARVGRQLGFRRPS